MATREWSLETTEAVRSVRLQHGYWSGRVVITVDGESIFERSRKLIDLGIEHAFTLDGIPCLIRIVPPAYFTIFFSYQFLPNEALPADSISGSFERRMRRRAVRATITTLLFVYLVSYSILSACGKYYPLGSGRRRYFNGLSMTDIRMWCPYGMYWQAYTNSRGENKTRGDALGYFYSPLIRIDRAFVHPTEYYFPSDG